MLSRISTLRALSIVMLAAATFGVVATASAQPKPANFDELDRKFQSIKWQYGPTKGKVGTIAEVDVPAGYKFSDRVGLLTLLELTMNPSSPQDMAVICPRDYSMRNQTWFLTFEWNAVGRVEDNDRGNLDGNAILESLKAGQTQDNQNRSAKGWPTLNLLGWSKAPFYDPETNLLTWATRISASDMPQAITVNYNSRVLGREGVMSVNLVCAEFELEKELPGYRQIVKGFSFVPGKRYAEWREGDKVAGYGLTALVAGGVVAGAAKSGLLGKLGKGLIYIVVAVGAGIVGIFKKLFGGRRQEPSA
jgi:uncharacterized membrane-anchored protein